MVYGIPYTYSKLDRKKISPSDLAIIQQRSS